MASMSYKYEIQLGGVWVDVTAEVRQDPPCVITRGQSDQADDPTPQTATFTLHNADQRFNPRYAPGPYFGQLVRNAPVRISAKAGPWSWHYRFYGEIAAWQPESNSDGSDRRVPIEAAGILRRLEVSGTRPRSAFRQWLNKHTGAPVLTNYWPLEDVAVGGQYVPDIGTYPGLLTNVRSPEKLSRKGEVAPWLPNVAAMIPGDELFFRVDMRGQYAGSWDVGLLVNFEDTETRIDVEIEGSPGTWLLSITPSDDHWLVTFPDGSTHDHSITPGGLRTSPLLFMLRQAVDGSGTSGHMLMSRFGLNLNSLSTLAASSRMSELRSITVRAAGTGDRPVAVGSVFAALGQSGSTGMTAFASPAGGYRLAGIETVGTRWDRLALESGVDIAFMGATGPQMGTQYDKTFLEHAIEMANTCAGLLIEDRDSAQLRLHPIASQNYSVPTTSIPLGEVVPEIEQVEDDRFTVNDVTVKNVDGNEQRAIKAAGDLSVAQVGRYAADVDANLRARLSEGSDLAAFLLARGSWPGPRFPSVTRYLHTLPDLTASNIMGNLSDPGATFQLTDLDVLGIADPVDLRVIGYTETFNEQVHTIEYNTVPADPYRQLTGSVAMRVDSDSATLAADATSTATSLSVATVNGLWSGAEQPFDITVGGERMTVTAVTGASSPQTLTVARSVNGVVKAQTTGTVVALYRPFYLRPKIGT